jgi:hypothetical protein
MQSAVEIRQVARPKPKRNEELEHKLRRMTILVGMVGSDGIVFAADQCMVRPAANVAEYDDIALVGKLEYLERHQVAYAGVGDQYTRQVESALSDSLDENRFDFGNIRRSLELLAVDTLREERAKNEKYYSPEEDRDIPDRPRALMVVFHGVQVADRQLWSLSVDPVRSYAYRVDGCRISGAIGNLARFFAQYYRPGIPIGALSVLASHIVLSANRFDSLMIKGLDIASFGSAGFHRFDESEKASLRSGHQELDNDIRKRLLPASAG